MSARLSQMRALTPVLILSLLMVAAPPGAAQTQPEWRLTQPLSDRERTTVVALAKRVGIGTPAVIANDVINQPIDCDVLRIESVPTVNGDRRTWQRVFVTNETWPRSHCGDRELDPVRVGNWMLASPRAELGAWRVRHLNWFVDVETPPGVPEKDVAVIVKAIARDRMVNRLPENDRRSPPKLNARAIYWITRDDRDPTRYKVTFRDTDTVVWVAVRGDRVELRGRGYEMS
jgi:hypothetical protein